MACLHFISFIHSNGENVIHVCMYCMHMFQCEQQIRAHLQSAHQRHKLRKFLAWCQISDC